MDQKMTRRRFGVLATASAAVATLGYLANKTLAQTPVPLLYGLTVQSKRLVIQTLDVTTLSITHLDNSANGITLGTGEQLSGFAILSDGTPLVVTSPSRSFKKNDYSPRIISLGTSPQTLTVSGLDKQDTILSIASSKNNLLYAIAAPYNFTGPFRLASIDLQTGQAAYLDSKLKLPDNQPFGNLALDSDGNPYATTFSAQSRGTSLVQLDLGKGQIVTLAQLVLDGSNWTTGLGGLLISPSNQFFALGNKSRYGTVNYLYTVNESTGKLTRLTKFDVSLIAFAAPT